MNANVNQFLLDDEAHKKKKLFDWKLFIKIEIN